MKRFRDTILTAVVAAQVKTIQSILYALAFHEISITTIPFFLYDDTHLLYDLDF